MSAISQKSITGITSITTPAGVDNQLTLHTNDTTQRVKVTQSGIEVVGVATFQNTDVDGHTDLDNVSIAGVTTFSNNVKFDGNTAGRDVTFIRSSNTLELATNAILELGNSGSGDCRLFNNGTDTRIINGDGTLKFESDTYEFKDKDNTISYLNITSDRKVGINRTSPARHLHTYAAGSGFVAKFEGSYSYSAVEFADSGTTNAPYIGSKNDHFTIATGGNNERLRIKSDGKIGIGTDNPQSLLSLHQSGGGFEINANSGSNNSRLLSYDRVASAYREMTFQALSYGFEVGGVERFDIDSNGHFKVTNGNAANFNTIQRHSTSLYCGIRIQDADATQRMQIGVAGGTNNIANGAAQHDVVLKSYANLLLATNQTERLRITSTGDVGVGDDSPNCRLVVKDTAEHAAFANATPTVGNSMFQLYNQPPNETANDHATIQFGVNGGSHNRVNTISAVAESAGNRKMAFVFCTDEAGSRTEKMRITGDGNLGVGVYSPSRKLDVAGDILGNTFMLRGNTSPSSSIQAQMYRPSDNTLAFATNGNNERMRIDSSGRVVVGGYDGYIGGAALTVLGTGTTPNTYGSFAIGKVGANPTANTTLANIRLNGGSVGTRRGAEINAKAANNWTDGSSHPTNLTFAVAKDGSAGVTDRVIINHYGHFQVTNENALPSGSTVGGTNGFKGLSQHGYQHWGQRQYYSGQRNLTQNGYFDLFQNNINHDDIIFWLNIKGYHSNRTFATAHGTIGGYGLSVSYQSASGVYGAFSGVDVSGTGGARRKLRWTSTSPYSANWWIWGWFSGTSLTTTHTGYAAAQNF